LDQFGIAMPWLKIVAPCRTKDGSFVAIPTATTDAPTAMNAREM
jgi:hypothetical protein